MDAADEKKAWEIYLLQTKHLRGHRYERVEPFSWATLQSRLGNLKVKRAVKKVA